MEQLLTTYKFYDDRKRRLSIFGEYSESKKGLNITIFTCSKNDTFSKKFAQELHRLWKSNKFEDLHVIEINDVNPQTFFVPCEKDKTKVPFMKWCKEHYKRIQEGGVLVPGKVLSFTMSPSYSGEIFGPEHTRTDTIFKIKTLI